MSALQDSLGQKEQSISDLQDTLNQRELSMLALQDSLGQKELSISDLQDTLNQRELSMSALQDSLGQKEQSISDLQDTLNQRELSMSALQDSLGQKEQSISDLQDTLNERNVRISVLTVDLETESKKVNRMKNSFIWKSTAPIRAIQKLFGQNSDDMPSLKHWIDSPKKPFFHMHRGELHVAGWCFDEATGESADRIFIKIGNREIKCEQVERNDVSKAYSINNTNVGFEARFTTGHGFKIIRIFCEYNGIKKPLYNFLFLIKRSIQYKNSSKKILSENKTPPEWEVPKIKFDDTENRYHEYIENQKFDSAVKVIAFYLPQFHPFQENDDWWGKGFTEWTNVTKAQPKYHGHYQPRLPTHLGFYDLRLPDVMEEQANLAKNYGVSGFNYYFYWFAGKTLMEKPLVNMLKNKAIDMPFCLTWANENWTRRWDGADQDVLISQSHSKQDSLAFIRYVMKYLKDERYITIDGKPVLMVYRADIIPDIKETTDIWREESQRHGLPGIYLVAIKSFGIKNVKQLGFDAAADFPPHTTGVGSLQKKLPGTDPHFKGIMYDYEETVREAISKKTPDEKTFGALMLGWDNTARKGNNANLFNNFSLLHYKQWLSNQLHKSFHNNKNSADEKIVLVNAWNEWAEGTYLEPDRKFGYGYLQSTYDVIKNYDNSYNSYLSFLNKTRKSDYAIIIHLHYIDVWEDILKLLTNSGTANTDVYITATSIDAIKTVNKDLPHAKTMLVENRGRDILPFLYTLKHIEPLGYSCVCKIHGKKSIYRSDGEQLRNQLYNALLGSEQKVSNSIAEFTHDSSLGMIIPQSSLLAHDDNNMLFNHERVQFTSKKIGVPFINDVFPTGSMFWFRPGAMLPLLKLEEHDFELEYGYSDGTIAHAVERLFVTVTKATGHYISKTEANVACATAG